MTTDISADLGDNAQSAVVGTNNKQIVTTTTTTATADGPRLEANPQIILSGPTSFDAIMLTLMQQNNVLSRLESKFDSHFIAVDIRFKALEKVTNTVEIAIGTIQEKLRIMDRTNAELEHASSVRGQQNATMEAQIREVRSQQTEINNQLERIKTALADAGHLAQATQATQAAQATQATQAAQATQVAQAAKRDTTGLIMFGVFIILMVAITVINFYLMRGGK